MPEEIKTPDAAPLRDEGGRFAATDSAPAAPLSDNQPGPAQDAVDPYKTAFAEVRAKHATESPALPADESLVSPSRPTAQPVTQTPAEAVGEEKPKAASVPLSAYVEGMDAQLYNLLKAEKKLPPAALWAEMSDEDRTNWADNIKHIRNARNRNFNSGRESQPGKQPPDSITPSTLAPRDEIPGNSPHTPKPRDAGESQTQLPPDIQEDLAALASEYGEDSTIYRSSLRMAIRNEERIAQFGQVTQQVEAERKAAQAEAASRRLEDTAARALAAKFPQLSDPAKLDLARQEARDFADMRARQGQPVTSAQAMEWAAKYHFSQENQQQAQKAADAARQRSLAGTFARTNRPAQAADSTAGEKDRSIFAALKEQHALGNTGETARKIALQSVR